MLNLILMLKLYINIFFKIPKNIKHMAAGLYLFKCVTNRIKRGLIQFKQDFKNIIHYDFKYVSPERIKFKYKINLHRSKLIVISMR